MKKRGMIIKTHNPPVYRDLLYRECIVPGLWVMVYDLKDHDYILQELTEHMVQILILFDIVEKQEPIVKFETITDISIIDINSYHDVGGSV